MDDDEPIFGCVEAIFIIASQVYLQVSVQTIVNYSSHFHAFVIAPTSPIQQKLVEPEQLVSPFPLQMRSVSGLTTHGNMAVVLKHSICVCKMPYVQVFICTFLMRYSEIKCVKLNPTYIHVYTIDKFTCFLDLISAHSL